MNVSRGLAPRLASPISTHELVLPTAAAVGASGFPLLQGVALPPSLPAAVWLFVYGSYAIDRLPDHLDSSRPTRAVLAAVALATSFTLTAVAAGPVPAALLAAFPLAVALYGLPIVGVLLPHARYARLKDVPYLKNLYTAFFWGLLGVYASVFCGIRGPGALLFAFVFCGSRFLVGTTYCDVKDVERDLGDGVRTFASTLGVRRTLAALHVVNLASALLVVPFVLAEVLPIPALALVLAALPEALVLGMAGRPGADHRRLALLWMDATSLAWLPLCALAH